MKTINFEERLKGYAGEFAGVVPFEPVDKLLKLDFTEKNKDLIDEILQDTTKFSAYINQKLEGYKYGIGGYGEHRTIYSRSEMFGPGPSPATGLLGQTDAKAPSQWEGEEEIETMAEEETVTYRFADPALYRVLREYVLQHRSKPTEAEGILWEALRTKQFQNYKFRRQHIIDRFIADFVCLKKALVIEVDGVIHQLPENKANDEERTKILERLGFQVLRVTNDEVIFELANVLERIDFALQKSSGAAPSPFVNEQYHTTLSQSGVRSADGLPTGKVGMGLPEPRRLHLGVDIWGPAETPVYAPLEGTVHSYAFNEAYGDYGATLILQHDINGFLFHTLYGHLSLASIQQKQEGQLIAKGEWIAAFGEPAENGHWPPHLHFQIIVDMQGMKGDYPGVCRFSEKEKYLTNCPDADSILGMMKFATIV